MGPMRQHRSIFLSAGVPEPSAKHFMGEGDTAAISALVSALLFVALGNVIVTEAVQGDRERSLEIMRRRMLSESSFEAAVFAGGMGGIFDEYRLVTELAAQAIVLPIVSTGGAAAVLGAEIKASSDLSDELDYVALLFDRLSIDPNEPRGAADPLTRS